MYKFNISNFLSHQKFVEGFNKFYTYINIYVYTHIKIFLFKAIIWKNPWNDKRTKSSIYQKQN